MNWPLIIGILVFISVIEPFLLLWGVARLGWRPLQRDFPARSPAQDAVTRNFQSMRLGMLNLAFCIHVTVDDLYLHVTPVAPFRWFGAGTASIPWESIEIVKRSRIGRWITARIGKRTLVGPKWCLKLAPPAEDAPPTPDEAG